MAKKKEAGQVDSTRHWALQGVIALAAVGGVLAAVIFLGRWGLEQVRGRDRYLVPFADIDCAAPPGLTRAEFLDEVRYEAQFAAQVGLLDDDLADRLRAAFNKHPWVEKVADVSVTPPRTIRLQLVFRRPVLAVPVDGKLVAVDGRGVRLPKTAATEGLPLYPGQAAPPGKAGQPWGDKKVEDHARGMQPQR